MLYPFALLVTGGSFRPRTAKPVTLKGYRPRFRPTVSYEAVVVSAVTVMERPLMRCLFEATVRSGSPKIDRKGSVTSSLADA